MNKEFLSEHFHSVLFYTCGWAIVIVGIIMHYGVLDVSSFIEDPYYIPSFIMVITGIIIILGSFLIYLSEEVSKLKKKMIILNSLKDQESNLNFRLKLVEKIIIKESVGDEE